MLNRRGFLKLGIGAAVVLGIAGGSLALLQPGLVDGRFGPRARALMRAVALAVLDGSWGANREIAIEAHLDRVERSLAVFPAGVRELNAGDGALRFDEGSDALQFGNVLVFPDAEIAKGDAAVRLNCCCFDDHQTGSSDGAAAQMDQVPVGGETVRT